MKHILFCILVCLPGCTQITPELRWVTPGEGANVTGTVELSVEAFEEIPPANVVFSVDARPVAKAYPVEGVFNAVWNSEETPSGSVKLTAKPYGGTPVTRVITVSKERGE